MCTYKSSGAPLVLYCTCWCSRWYLQVCGRHAQQVQVVHLKVFRRSLPCSLLYVLVLPVVPPRYADATRSKFKSSTRLECMMQDFPKTLTPDHKVGFTVHCSSLSLPLSLTHSFMCPSRLGLTVTMHISDSAPCARPQSRPLYYPYVKVPRPKGPLPWPEVPCA